MRCVMVVHAKKRRRSERLEIRTTPDERAVIDRAVVASGSDLTEFVITSLTIAARQVMADRATFDLDADAQRAWEGINRREPRELRGLRALMDRPSPFTES